MDTTGADQQRVRKVGHLMGTYAEVILDRAELELLIELVGQLLDDDEADARTDRHVDLASILARLEQAARSV